MSNEQREPIKEDTEVLLQLPTEKIPETPEEKMQFEAERAEKKFALFFDLLEFIEQHPKSYLAEKFQKLVILATKGK